MSHPVKLGNCENLGSNSPPVGKIVVLKFPGGVNNFVIIFDLVLLENVSDFPIPD